MAITPADEKLRQQQLRALRRQWLKDQELSPREPVLPPKKLGPVEAFWENFMRVKSPWRRFVFNTYTTGKAAAGGLVGIWVSYYILKYHLAKYVTFTNPQVFPGDVIAETGETVPPLNEPTSHNHHHHHH